MWIITVDVNVYSMCNITAQRAILLKRCVFKFVYNIPAKYEFKLMTNVIEYVSISNINMNSNACAILL